MKSFKSALAPQLEQYIAYRQNLGYAKKPVFSYLQTFDRYLTEQKLEPTLIKPSLFLELRANLKMEARSINKILSTTRVFFQFLVRKSYYLNNPLQDVPLLPENAVAPFVFSPIQIEQLLGAVCKRIRKNEKYFLTDMALCLAIVLLARCAMRISEPLQLLHHHYRHDDGTIYIEKTKFKKDRLIPAPKAVMMEIENYLQVRKSLLPDDQNPYLLAGKEKKGLTDDQVRRLFHKSVKDIGLGQKRQVIANTNFSSPTPHSLRHSFAINTLKRIKEQGKSPNNALPVLADYMGHSSYKNTTTYLKFIDAQQRQQLFHFATSKDEDK
jgi:site-specific recombinase XerD